MQTPYHQPSIDQIIWSIFPNKNSKKTILIMLRQLLFTFFSLLFFQSLLLAEGTKQIRPNEADKGYLILDPQWSPFATYDCPADLRLMISVCNPGEKIYFGLNQSNGDVKFRIKDSNGNIVFNEQNVPTSGAGFIATHSQAIAGPSAIVGATGYNALSFTPATVGDYYLEFTNVGSRRDFELFDITVASAANKAVNGRIWSKSWMFSTRGFDNVFEGKMYIYADDGIVTSIDFNGMQPFVFVLSANKSGTKSTGNTFQDRQSTQGRQTYPQYKIFLTEPDVSCYPTGSFGKLTKPVTITGCGQTRCINISVDKAGDVEILLDLTAPVGYQANTRDRILPATVKPGDNCIPWDSKDGKGVLMKAGESVPLEVNYFNGLTHMPLFDVEGNKNGYIVDLIRPTGARPKLFWDDTKIVPSTPPNNQNLAGCNSVTGCHQWLWAGSDNGATDYGNTNTINTWWYANIINANANYVIQDVSVDANVSNPPKAPNDTTVCASVTTVQLFGGVFGANGGNWSGGSNAFSPSKSTLAAVYTPSAAEKAAGKVKLTLTSNTIDDCPAVFDTMRIFFTPTPIAEPGIDQLLCENITKVSLIGKVTNATGGKWSGGGGTFTPDANNLTTVYTPTVAEKAGTVNLTLTTTGSGVCSPSSKAMKINFFKGPAVNLGKDTVICANNPVIQLKPTITVATKGTWTGGSGNFSPDRNTSNATYTATVTEVKNGNVTLTFSTTDNGNCNAGTDQLLITFSKEATANAGSDQAVCINAANISLNGKVSGASGGKWLGGTGSYNPNATSLSTKYIPTPAEINAGKLTLFLETVGSSCANGRDTIVITFTPGPTIKAGADKNVCENNATTQLNAIITGATGVEWKIASGAFVPNNLTANATYTPSKSDIDAKVAALVVSTTGNGTCNPASDTILILIAPAPTVDITSANKIACSNNPFFSLTANTTNAQSGKWSGGLGTISPKTDTTSITYIATNQEVKNGIVKLTYAAQKGGCATVIDTINLTFKAAPTIDAGPNQTICINNPKVSLSGSVVPTNNILWSGGQGTFADTKAIATTYAANNSETNATVKLYLTTNPTDNCKPVKDSLEISFSPSPTVNAGVDKQVCNNNPIIPLAGNFTVAGGAVWSGGVGTFSPNANDITATYTPSPGEVASGSLNLVLTTTANGNCNSVKDDLKISFTPGPKANAGADITACADNAKTMLNGSVTLATGGIWSGGKGTFSPDVNTLNASYTPTLEEINTGKVTLLLTTTGNGDCNSHSDDIVINITPSPSANAGPDQTACLNVGTIKLNGSLVNSATGKWNTLGTGTFSPSTTIVDPKYQPSEADINKGEVKLVFTTTGNNLCKSYLDTMVISFTVSPKINAGPDQTICTNDLPIKLKATGSAGQWVSGSGTFFPDKNTLNSIYTPTASEINNGFVLLKFVTTSGNTCPSVFDEVKFTIPAAPRAEGGPDQTICANTKTINLKGTITNATSGFWSSNGTGTFTAPANALETKYQTSLSDQTKGNVVFTFTSIGNNFCTPDSSKVTATITPEIKVDAGPEEKICSDVKTISLKGISNAPTATWSTSGNGQFMPSNTDLNAKYNPSTNDANVGSVTLTLSTLPSGSCPAVSAQKIITITPAPTANAGPDVAICADSNFVKLNGIITIAKTGIWTTKGSGSFSPNGVMLNPSYFPSAADTLAGKVMLKFTTDGNGTCNAVSDSMVISIAPKPILNIGKDLKICADEPELKLTSSVVHATNVSWSSTGNGTYNPSANQLNTSYVLMPQDITKGLLVFTAKTTGNGLCKAVSSKITVNIVPKPTVTTGGDQTICADAGGVQLAGKITVAEGGVWTSNGTGKFLPDSTNLDAVYKPSNADTASKNITLTLTTTGNGLCAAKSSITKITINPIPIVNPGTDQTVCEDTSAIALLGKVFNATGGIWTSTGTGNFFPNNKTLNAKYVPSTVDKKDGKVIFTLTSSGAGTCNAVNKAVTVTIIGAPNASIGNDTLICDNTPSLPLRSSLNNGAKFFWSTSGSGKFSPDSLVANPIYIPSVTDRKSGLVYVTFHGNGVGTCKPVKAQQKIKLIPQPTIIAGIDQTICESETSINVLATTENSANTKWQTQGSGIFETSADSLATKYVFSTSDKASLKTNLIIKALGVAGCGSASDTLAIFITPVASINVGADQKICADASDTPVVATLINATGVIWKSNSNGAFSPSNTKISTLYEINTADKTATSITITGTTTGTGVCPAVSDDLIISITPSPTVNAGVDRAICADAEFIDIKGVVTVASNGQWTTSGSGIFAPSDTNLTTTYFPTASDRAVGSINLTLTTLGNGTCKPVSDNVLVTISPAPSLSAGPDQTVCPDVSSVPLNPTLKIATGINWTTSGTGNFNPNSNTTFASYAPTPADIALGSVTLTATTTGNGLCNSISDNIIINFNILAPINAGPDNTLCSSDVPIQLSGFGTTGTWSGGAGVFSPNNNTLNATYQPTIAELNSGKIKLLLTSATSGTCAPSADEVEFTINPGPTAQAGNDENICETSNSIAINGQVTLATGGRWQTSGTGKFVNANNLNTTYNPSDADKKNGTIILTLLTTGNGICKEVKDMLTLKVTPLPKSNAGADVTICADVANVPLAGTFGNTSGATWLAVPGGGSFSNASMNPSFAPSAIDKTNGKVKIVLLTNANSPCPSIADTMQIFITPQPTVTVNADGDVCADTNSISLKGTITIAGGGKWTTTGTGKFSPNEFALNALYNLSEADKKSTNITTTLTTIDNGSCGAQAKSFALAINPAPIVNAGGDMETCADKPSVSLKANLQNSGGVIWKTKEMGNYIPDAAQLNTTYVLTKADIDAGLATFIVSTTGNGKCKAVSDFINIAINPTPTAAVNAGFDQILCADKKTIALNGLVTLATGGVWKTLGSGSFQPSNTALDAVYVPSAADTTNKKVNIILSTTGNGLCNAVTDTMLVSLVPTPKVNAGIPLTICADSSRILLNGLISNATTAAWSTSGSGFFTPNPGDLKANYILSASDLALNKIGITLTTGNGDICEPVAASLVVTITPKPKLILSEDQLVCSNIAVINLKAETTVAKGIIWKTTADGSIEDPQSLQTNYLVDPKDVENGGIKITATTTGNGSCKPATEDFIVKFTPAPIVNAGPDITVCADATSIDIAGNSNNATQTIWKTLGTGTFEKSNLKITKYQPSASDKNLGTVQLVLTAIGTNDCGSTNDTILITLQPAPILAVQSANLCPDEKGAQLGVTFQNANAGQWSSTGSGTFSPDAFAFDAKYFPSANDVLSGKTTLSFTTSKNGVCGAITATLELKTITPPRANAGVDKVVCRGAMANLMAISNPNQTYRWITLSGNEIAKTQSTTISANSDTLFVLTTADVLGCTSNDTVKVSVIDPPKFDLKDQFCLSDTLEINSNPSNIPPVNGLFQWARNNSYIEGETKPIIFPADAGKFKILYSYESCSTLDTTIVNAPPELITKSKFGCLTDQVSLETSTITNATYTWSKGNTTIGNTNPLSTATLSDTTFYSVKVTDAAGCTTRDSARIIGISKPILTLKDITACTKDNIVLRAKPINFPNTTLYKSTYMWTKDQIVLAEKSDSLKVLQAGEYIVKATIEVCSTSDTSKVILNPVPLAVLMRKAEFCSEVTIEIPNNPRNVELDANNGQTLITYLWEKSKSITQKETVNTEGIYRVTLTNQFNCKLKDSISVADNCPPMVYLPNAIKPGSNNGDQAYKVFGRNFTNFQILVFSRWGEVIFKSNDRYEVWDGTYRGEPMPIGVYPYIVTYQGDSETYKEQKQDKGTITIVR